MNERDETPDTATIVAEFRDTTGEWSTQLGEPVTCERLAEVESKLQLTLPADLRQFYRIANGIECEVITKYNAYTSFIGVFSVEHLILYTQSLDKCTNHERKKEYGSVRHRRFIAFGDLLDGDLCCLDLDRPAHGKPYTIIATDHEQPRTWPTNAAIATSMGDWLERILRSARGREFLDYWERQDTRSWPPEADRPPNAIR